MSRGERFWDRFEQEQPAIPPGSRSAPWWSRLAIKRETGAPPPEGQGMQATGPKAVVDPHLDRARREIEQDQRYQRHVNDIGRRIAEVKSTIDRLSRRQER
jgi:hypothetical protein